MYMHKWWSGALITLPVALVIACGGSADSDNGFGTDADRQLELALSGDRAPATFEDTALTPINEIAEPGATPASPPARRPSPAQAAPTPAADASPVEAEPEPAVQPPAADPEPVVVTRTVPIGTTMQLSLDETLSTRSNEVGDAFTATLTASVLDVDGSVLVPAGATLRGRVTQVQKSGRVGETAVLSLAFEAVTFGDSSYPLEASVVSANPERVSRSTTADHAGKAAAGAVAGGILGTVLGRDTKSAIKGAVIGAAAGTAIAMGTADVDAVLKEGSVMVIRTDAPVTIVTIES